MKKIQTNEESISRAEAKLEFSYPDFIRTKLTEHNGFDFGGFRFYPVLDDEDKEHTFDDVVRENENNVAGWSHVLPDGYVAIADDGGQGCLVLSKEKASKIQYWNNDTGTLEPFAKDAEEFENQMISSDLT